MSHLRILAVCFGIAAMLAACKPTEKNYKEAYDLALQKEREGLDEETFAKIKAESEPKWRVIGTDSAQFEIRPFSPVSGEGAEIPLKPYNVAIGKYKMMTTAVSHRSRLLEKKYPAAILTTPDKEYYVIIAECEKIEDALDVIKSYTKENPEQKYIGLSRPLIAIPVQSGKR